MDVVVDNLPLYWDGFQMTLRLTLVSAVAALVLGTLLGGFRVSPVPTLRGFGTVYVELLRNTPLTLVFFFMVFVAPQLGVKLPFETSAYVALSLYTAAFVCEAVRSGVNSVGIGQAEAARAIGLTFTQTMSQVVLPQALRTVVPPLGSVIIAMFKNSAVVGAFGVGRDLFSVGESLTSAQGYASLPVLTGVAIGYLLITLPAGAILGLLEHRLAIVR
jgi:glutamate transport system permease protein